MTFHLISRAGRPPSTGKNACYLRVDLWNDFSFITMFDFSLHDDEGNFHDVGKIKIGYRGQTTATPTYKTLSGEFSALGAEYFSLGEGDEFYRNMSQVPEPFRREVLKSLNDLVLLPSLIEEVEDEPVFGTSLLRQTSLSVVRGQYARLLDGKPALTNFSFAFERPAVDKVGAVNLDFRVEANSKPSTNVHAIIGRNGSGKTTILNGMTRAIASGDTNCKFYGTKQFVSRVAIEKDYFSSLVSASFSAFDPFFPPKNQPDPAKGTCYYYVGFKNNEADGEHKPIDALQRDSVRRLISCFMDRGKRQRWLSAIARLNSDDNFAAMGLENLLQTYDQLRSSKSRSEQVDSDSFRERYFDSIEKFLGRMSSGHAVVFITITFLVAHVEEKTLVLLDEPESHLHPPLLAAFVRSLSALLHDRNGVAIIATHSPVVLQEIPKSCVWKIHRSGLVTTTERPTLETFGENVGILTSEVFGLEVERSGFHALLRRDVQQGLSYEAIVAQYGEQLGLEARAVLGALLASRSASGEL